MAAHLEGKGASVLDFTGFAQKFGPVLSFIRIAAKPAEIHQVRIDQAAADALIGCDIVVSSSPKAAGTYRPAMRAVINTAEMPTGDIVRNRDASLAVTARLQSIARIVGPDHLASFDANAISDAVFGDTVFANVIMLGAAWQNGLVPVSLEALMRAIELNDVAIDDNKRAFACGRLAVAAANFATSLSGSPQAEETLEQIIARRAEFLTAYQSARYAQRYLAVVNEVRADEGKRLPGSQQLTDAVARALFKLMAYKDEYEVARLHTDTGLKQRLGREFEGDFAIKYHLAPPLLPAGRDARGRPLKRAFGSWIEPAFRALARLKFLRGTPFDPFGHTRERRMERNLIGWYESLLTDLRPLLHAETAATLVEIAALPMEIKGYGPVKDAAVENVMTKIGSLRARLPQP
jgi:indolepyruvate ferredoxin oxidoreductase